MKIAQTTAAPVLKWDKTNLIQGVCWAVDPKTKKQYLFVGQAADGGAGDLEDTLIHMHLFDGRKMTYVSTFVGKKMGHPQSFHVRFSILGNPWLWLSVEQYEGTKRVGARLARVPYKKGTFTTKSKGFTYIKNTVGNSLSPIPGPYVRGPGMIYVRRAQTDSETYSEHFESDLVKGVWKPVRFFKTKRGSGTYQSSAASAKEVARINGATEQKHWVYRFDWTGAPIGKPIEVTGIDAESGPNTSSEGEAVVYIDGVLHFAKRYNSTSRRVYAVFSIKDK